MRSTVQGSERFDDEYLVFYVTAASKGSYDGAGNKWLDVSNTRGNVTLYNFPVYTGSNMRGIKFSSASNQYWEGPVVPITTEPFAVDVWFTAGNTNPGGGYDNNWMGLVSTADIVSSAGSGYVKTGWAIGYTSDQSRLIWGVSATSSVAPGGPVLVYSSYDPSLVVGQNYNIVMHRNTDDGKLKLYVNGILQGSGITLPSTASVSSSFKLNTKIYKYGSSLTNHTYHSIKIYKGKNFTDSDILNNYNNYKAKIDF